jgi:DNA-binding NarL/FixJ family response regulator
MDILLIESDKVTRDHIKVGLECFKDFQVEVAEGVSGINRVRQKSYDYILIGHEAGMQDGIECLDTLREFDKETAVVIVATTRQAKPLVKNRNKLNIYSFLSRPVNEQDFFRLVARMRERSAAKA